MAIVVDLWVIKLSPTRPISFDRYYRGDRANVSGLIAIECRREGIETNRGGLIERTNKRCTTLEEVNGRSEAVKEDARGIEGWKLWGKGIAGRASLAKKGIAPCERWTEHSSTSLLSATNNDLAPLSTDEFAFPVREKASQGRDVGGMAGRCWNLSVSFTTRYFRPWSRGTETREGLQREREKKGVRKGPRWYGRKLYCIYCEMKFLEATILGVLWQPSNPRRRTFVATKTFLASPIRDNEPRPLSLWNTFVHYFSRTAILPIQLGVPLFYPLSSSIPRLIHGYSMAIVEIFIVRGRGEEGRPTVRAGSSF